MLFFDDELPFSHLSMVHSVRRRSQLSNEEKYRVEKVDRLLCSENRDDDSFLSVQRRRGVISFASLSASPKLFTKAIQRNYLVKLFNGAETKRHLRWTTSVFYQKWWLRFAFSKTKRTFGDGGGGYAYRKRIEDSPKLRSSVISFSPVAGGKTFDPPAFCYQLDLVTPGNKQSWAISRNTCRETPKSLKKPFGRPVKRQRLWSRAGAPLRGRFCNLLWIVSFSSNWTASFIRKSKAWRLFLYLTTNRWRFFSRSIMLFFAIG